MSTNRIHTATVTIPINEAVSSIWHSHGLLVPYVIQLPAAWTAAALRVKVSFAPIFAGNMPEPPTNIWPATPAIGTFVDLKDGEDDTFVEYTVTAGNAYHLHIPPLANYLALVSTVNQLAARDIVIVSRPID